MTPEQKAKELIEIGNREVPHSKLESLRYVLRGIENALKFPYKIETHPTENSYFINQVKKVIEKEIMNLLK